MFDGLNVAYIGIIIIAIISVYAGSFGSLSPVSPFSAVTVLLFTLVERSRDDDAQESKDGRKKSDDLETFFEPVPQAPMNAQEAWAFPVVGSLVFALRTASVIA
jgi:hypothetical protein